MAFSLQSDPADPNRMKIGHELRAAREAAGLTQTELATKANVHRTYVSQLERDVKSPTLDVFVRIAGALGVRASKLLAEAEEQAAKRSR